MSATITSLSLYQIESELLQLMELRDEVAGMTLVREGDAGEREQQLAAIDQSIAEYVRREVTKVDNVAGFLRECKTRAAVLKQEEERVRGLRKTWEDREARLKDRIAEALAMDVDPQAIVEAAQNSILKRLHGRSNELKLCKSPESVEITDASLVPSEFRTVTVTMPLAAWDQIRDQVPGFRGEESISKTAIGKALKDDIAVAGARLIESNVHIRIS